MLTSIVPRVLQDALAPDGIEIDVTPASPLDPDPGTATAASVHVRMPNGEEVVWTTTFTAAAGVATVKHGFASGDLPMLGEYIATAKLTLPAGVYGCAPRRFRVVDAYDAQGAPPGVARLSTHIA